MTQEQTPTPQDEQDERAQRAKEHVDPASNPGPPGNPDTDEDALAKGRDKLDGTLPY
jgi:hypothetical protein